jgi:hypothetical protein
MALEPSTSLAKQARAVERDVFGALIGTLVAVVLSRLVVLAIDINLYVLMAVVFVGAWSGAFVVHFGSSHSGTALASMKSVADRYRAFCLRTMLWMLGAAAVLGVLSVLTGSFDIVGRVAGTTAATAIAAGFLWPFLALLDEQKNWRVGLLGAASVFAAYFMAVPSIWELGYRWEETALSAMVIVLMMPVGLVAMQITHVEIARVAGVVASLLYAVALSCFLFAVWDQGWRSADELSATGFALLGFGTLAVASLVGAGFGDRRYWRWLGVLASSAVSAMCLWGIWTNVDFDTEWIIGIASIAVVVGHANLSLYAPLKGSQDWWRIGTIAAVVATATALDLNLLLGTHRGGGISILGRISLASGILASAGTLGMLVLARLNRSLDTPETIDGVATIQLQCPRCGKRQAIPLGQAPCAKCGVRIKVEIEDAGEVSSLPA